MTRQNLAALRQTVAQEQATRDARRLLLQSYVDGTHPSKSTVTDQVRGIISDALSADYRVWRGTQDHASNPFLLQKRIREGSSTLYFVNLHFWDLGIEFGYRADYQHFASITPEAQFYLPPRHGGGRSFDLKIHPGDKDTLSDIEGVFRDFYDKMKCTPYEADT